MSIRTSISIDKILVLSTLLLTLGCNDHSTSPSKGAEQSSTDKPIEADKAKNDHLLTDENIASFLKDYSKTENDGRVLIETAFGEIEIKLYENTPLHKANFLFLTEKGYYSNTWFYRVSEGHVVQAGNTDDRQTVKEREAIGNYSLPAEALDLNMHRYGAVAAARPYKSNPERRSDPFEFYISLGRVYSERELDLLEEKYNMTLRKEQRKLYTTKGGSPHLDGQHTVFGEVVRGMDVIEAISKVRVDDGEWPYENIPIKVSLSR